MEKIGIREYVSTSDCSAEDDSDPFLCPRFREMQSGGSANLRMVRKSVVQ